MKQDYLLSNDLSLALELLHLQESDLANALSVDAKTLSRWRNSLSYPSEKALNDFYSYLYKKGVRLSESKGQFYQEEAKENRILFHGSKEGIDGDLSLLKSHPNKDFGTGFYCGESVAQSASFVSMFPHSSLYIVSFDPQGLSPAEFRVDREWMLAIAYYRGQLVNKKNNPLLQRIFHKVEQADYLIAPIADNRMFEIIGEFIDGSITDVQCQHALSATDLGRQYVIRSEKALKRVQLLEHCFLCDEEKTAYLSARIALSKNGVEKAAMARIKYKGEGCYLGEILP